MNIERSSGRSLMDKLAWNELLERATHFDLEYGVPREYSTYQKEKTVPFKLFETEYESLSEVLDLVEAFTTHDSLGGIVF